MLLERFPPHRGGVRNSRSYVRKWLVLKSGGLIHAGNIQLGISRVSLECTSSVQAIVDSLSLTHTLTTIASDVACLRPSLSARGGQQQAPGVSFSSQQSDKLWSLLVQLKQAGGYSHTFGALDPVQVTQMGPHLSSIYISGWQCSSTASTT